MSPTRESILERTLAAGHKAVAVELTPPVGPNLGALERRIEHLRGFADAFNVTDNQTAKVHASSLAVSILVRQAGLEPVLQLTCRDRNRLGLQSDLMGAALWGITNVVALSGDHPAVGDHPHVRPVADIDSMNLVRLICWMRDTQTFESGRKIPKRAPHFFVGAVANPFAPPLDFRPYRLAKKIAAGAQFIQTQLIFNLERFREYMSRVVDLGLHEKVSILAGIGLVRSSDLALHLRENVAGIDVPDEILKHLSWDRPEDQQKAGFDLALETAAKALQVEGVHGIHLMPMGVADSVPELVRELGMYPRPIAAEG